MIELQGKYNSCKVYTDNVDNTTISQLITLLNQEFTKDNQIRIMPDCHAGTGCVIGTTMTLTDKVVPNLVGVDIGCGMLACKLEEMQIDYKKLDEVIRKYVPSGFDIHERTINCNFDPYSNDLIAPVDKDRAMKSLGTLGGGNHFIEFNKGSDGHLWMVIHTGSRHLGTEVCKYYQELAYRKIKNSGTQEKIQEIVQKLKSEGRQGEIENALKNLKGQTSSIPKDLCYVKGKDFDDYIHDMGIVQKYAEVNRKTIAGTITKHMGLHIDEMFQTIHNYIDLDNMILRKGAVSAEMGESLIIPINMRDGSLICVGKGNPDWNYSAPHGAGRIMSRGQAKEMVDLEDFKASMEGIYTTSVGLGTLDESPFVYKSMEEIIENIEPTVQIIDRIIPVYNFKASEQEKVKELEEVQEDLER